MCRVDVVHSLLNDTMSCQDEAGAHDHGCAGHDQGHGGHDGHDHDVPMEAGPADSLYPVIDTEHVVAMNAAGGGEQGRVVIKSVSQDCWLQS